MSHKSLRGWKCGARHNAKHWASNGGKMSLHMSEEQIKEMKRKIK